MHSSAIRHKCLEHHNVACTHTSLLTLLLLQDVMGGCERIFRTPIPLSYTRHTSRFLVCWLTLLPFCVADAFGWLTVPISIGLAFFLFGIEVRARCRSQEL
jgi:predicted membrane chloride channel (bestrophin family)